MIHISSPYYAFDFICLHVFHFICNFLFLEYNNNKILESQDLQDVISPNVKVRKKNDYKDGKIFQKFAHFWVIMNNEPCMGVLINKTLNFTILKYNPSIKSIKNIVTYVNENVLVPFQMSFIHL
jgi:hypothetical protein